MSSVPMVRLWLWISAFASVTGWTLSALGQLNRAGYAIAFVVFFTFLLASRKWMSRAGMEDRGSKMDNGNWSSIHHLSSSMLVFIRRFRRPLPLCFAILTVLIFLGGVLYPPSNYAGLNYRLPRVLQWLAQGHWFWIHTPVFRMNDRACGIEWLTAPLVLFTKSDRLLFLLNFLPFLLLPGLTFSLFTRLGIRARVAWHWMWLLPTGYDFLLQAGSIANDTFPAVYALAALDFAARAWSSRRVSDVWHSILAAALLTGAKASNLPLLLPWAILIFAVLPLMRRRPVVTLVIMLLAALVSFAPSALLNIHYLGDWSGLSIERSGMDMKNPAVGIWGNALLITFNNFVPPLCPFAGWWNQNAPDFLPQFLFAPLQANFEQGFYGIGELPTEDWTGIGFGLSVLLLVSLAAARFGRGGRRTEAEPARASAIPRAFCQIVLLAPWLSLLAYAMKSGMVTPQRLIAPYYLLLVPVLLADAGQSQIIRRGWWRALTAGVMAFAFMILILSPDRPLWPAKTVLNRLHDRHPGQRTIDRALKVYTVYSRRSDPLAAVRTMLPPNIKTVGFIGSEDDSDISLWRPYGGRKVDHFFLTDPPEQIRRQVQYVVVGGLNVKEKKINFRDWLQHSGAELVAVTNIMVKVSDGPQPWLVVRVRR